MTTQSTPYDQRFLWTSGSACSIYSRSQRRWFRGVIARIFIERTTREEWFVVRYNQNRHRKAIQRLNSHIKPLSNASLTPNHTLYRTVHNTLSLCSFSRPRTHNIVSITCGLNFNIYAVATHYDELIVFGFIHSHISHTSPSKRLKTPPIPNHIRLLILRYFGHNYNRYWSCGHNDFGQCCVGHTTSAIPHASPAPIEFPMGNQHKLCAGCTSRNVLWLGNDGGMHINGRNLHKYITSMDISMPLQCMMTEQCCDAACSHFTCMVVCRDGSVWSLGRGVYGELGHGRHPKLFSDFFGKIKTLDKQFVIAVRAGYYFTLFLCADGSVWSCGMNTSAECGLGYVDEERNRLPTKIEYFERIGVTIKSIECGESHSLALSEGGKVFCWGNNEYMQCGMVDAMAKDVTVPSVVKELRHVRVVEIKCGLRHSACRTEHGEWFVWGCNCGNECCLDESDGSEGENGEGDAVSRKARKLVLKPHCINEYVLAKTDGQSIVDIALGTCCTMIIVSDNVT